MLQHFIGNLKNCSFIKYPVCIVLSELMQFIRNAQYATQLDLLVVQALIELRQDFVAYGPFELAVNDENEVEQLKLYEDEKLVFAVACDRDTYTIQYVRDGNLAWIESLAALAEAHANKVHIDIT